MDLGLLPKKEGWNLSQLISLSHLYSYDLSGQFFINEMILNKSGVLIMGDLITDRTELIVKSLNIDALNFAEIREWIGSSWGYTPGNHELRQIEIEIRDINGGALYSNWEAVFYKLRNFYPEDQQWTIDIFKLNSTSFKHLGGGQVQAHRIVYTKNAILRGLSSLRLDSEDSSISTFTLTFFYDPFPFVAEETKQQ